MTPPLGEDVPRLPEFITDCSIYFYASEREAQEGSHFGGSGFLAHVPSKVRDNTGYVYALTNKHVLDRGFHVIRLTKKTGGTDTIQTRRQDRVPHPNGDDVEVLSMEINSIHKWWSVGTPLFLTHEKAKAYRVGLGDEIFLVGRLVTHGGRQKNTPVVRFGNISLVADLDEPIQCEEREQEAFLVECRSLSGFSGSPVFVTTTQTYSGEAGDRLIEFRQKEMGYDPSKETNAGTITTVSLQGTFGPWLLGIDWGHIPLWKEVYEHDRTTKTTYQIEQNTGIACVLPAWKVMEALNQKELVKDRHRQERELADDMSANAGAHFP